MSVISLYFDPGSGALIVQLLVAAGASVALFYKRIVTTFKSFIGKKESADLLGDIDVEEKQDAAEK